MPPITDHDNINIKLNSDSPIKKSINVIQSQQVQQYPDFFSASNCKLFFFFFLSLFHKTNINKLFVSGFNQIIEFTLI